MNFCFLNLVDSVGGWVFHQSREYNSTIVLLVPEPQTLNPEPYTLPPDPKP